MGVILFEMCARRVPFDANDLKGLISRITRDPIPMMPQEYSSSLRTLFQEMMTRNVDRRPSAQDVLKKPIVQEVVRKLLGEVKPDEPQAQAANGGAVGDHSQELAGEYAANAGRYSKGDLVEYYSATHGEWLPANVTAADPSGKIVIDVKPNAWLTLEVQAEKIRPRAGDANAAPNGKPPAAPAGAPPKSAAGVRQPSNGPQPKSGGGGRDASPGVRGRSPGAAGRQASPAPAGKAPARSGSRGRG